MSSMESKVEPNISLLNFEDVQFEDSSYILTSPRSLEACSRLNIKPVEVLTRSLEDFRDELLPRGMSVRKVFEIYNEYERERQNKLQLCIEERQRIINENLFDIMADENDLQTVIVESDHRSLSDLKPALKKTVQNRTTPRNKNSRKRTDTLQNEKNSSCSRKSRYDPRDYSGKRRQSSSDLDARLSKLTSNAEKKLNRLRNDSSEFLVQSEKKKLHPRFNRSRSDLGYESARDTFSETGSVASSRFSARSSRTDVTYVTDSQLREKLRGSLNSQTRLRAKDQKILSMMLQKKEQDKEEGKRKEEWHTLWEEEKMREQRERDDKDNERRLELAKRRSYLNEIRATSEAQRLEMEDERQKEREVNLQESYKMSAESLRRQQMMKLLKIKERQIEEIEKKKSMDLRLEQQRKDELDRQSLVKVKLESELLRANSLKLTKEQEQVWRTRMKNRQSKEKHDLKMTAIQQQSLDDLALLQKSLDFRDRVVENQLSRQRWQNNVKTRERQKELERKIEQSHKNQQEIEDEIQNWHRQLAAYHNMQETRAVESARRSVSNKSQKAYEQRATKEKLQKEKMKQIHEKDEQWKRDMEIAIKMKKLRIQSLLDDREKLVQESRSLSGTAERLRGQLKQSYSTADLDDLDKKAKLENKILFRPHSRTMIQQKSENVSRLLIG